MVYLPGWISRFTDQAVMRSCGAAPIDSWWNGASSTGRVLCALKESISSSVLRPLSYSKQKYRPSCSNRRHTKLKSVSRYCTLYSRSEEHTSELQSLAYLVCRLLLEKKKIVFHFIIW